MTTPFSPYVNFAARFTVPSGALVRDDTTGNVRVGTTEVIVTAVMKQNTRPQIEPRPGIDTEAIFLEGILVSPLPLPDVIRPDTPCIAVFNGRTGKFWYETTARNPYLIAVNVNIVDKIRGWFQFGYAEVVKGSDTGTIAVNYSGGLT